MQVFYKHSLNFDWALALNIIQYSIMLNFHSDQIYREMQ